MSDWYENDWQDDSCNAGIYTKKEVDALMSLLSSATTSCEESKTDKTINKYFRSERGIYHKFFRRLLDELDEDDVKAIMSDMLDKISKDDRMLSDFHLNKTAETAIIEFMTDRG